MDEFDLRAQGEVASGEISFPRVDMITIVSLDLGWLCTSVCESVFLHDRGRSGWLADIKEFVDFQACGFSSPHFTDSAYARSREHGSCTFSEEYRREFMPLSFKNENKKPFLSDKLAWIVEEVRLGVSGAIAVHIRAWPEKSSIGVNDLINSYHVYRRDVIEELQALLKSISVEWNKCLPNYTLNTGLTDSCAEYSTFYDVIDVDLLIGGKIQKPKDLYECGSDDIIKAIAGVTRMSGVYEHYYGAKCRENIRKSDLGNRDDEFWIVNSERMLRYHPEHTKDIAKQMFFCDVITGIDILLAQRASLDFLVQWIRKQRTGLLEKLPLVCSDEKEDAMRELLNRLAWSADLYGELPAMQRTTGSSFFAALMARLADLKELDRMQQEILRSISQVLQIAEAIFSERTAKQTHDAERQTLELNKASKRVSTAALITAIVAAILAFVQITVAIIGTQTATVSEDQVIRTIESFNGGGNSK